MKGNFYLIYFSLMITQTLFLVALYLYGNNDIAGGLFVLILSFAIVALLQRGLSWFKWIGIVGFSLLAVATALAGVGEKSILFFINSCGYMFVVWQLTQVKKINTKQPMNSSLTPTTTGVNEDFVIEGISYETPLLRSRILALMIDGIILMTALILIMIATDGLAASTTIKVAFWALAVCVYEPCLTVYSCTIGQRILGIRVRQAQDPTQSINLVFAFIRMIVKDMLGFLSFLTIHTNPQRRAIHDLAAGSVVITVRKGSV